MVPPRGAVAARVEVKIEILKMESSELFLLRRTISAISIRGRQAIGAVYFHMYCAHFKIKHPYIDNFVTHMFDLALTENIIEWEKAGPELVLTGLGYSLPIEISCLLRSENRREFEMLTQHVTEIGYGDLYGAVTKTSEQNLVAAFAILRNIGLRPPDVHPFLVSSFSKTGGWGDPVPFKIVQQWKKLLQPDSNA